MQNNQVPVQFIIGRKVKGRIKALAAERGMSIGALFRQALQEKFEREGIKFDVNEDVQEWGANRSQDN